MDEGNGDFLIHAIFFVVGFTILVLLISLAMIAIWAWLTFGPILFLAIPVAGVSYVVGRGFLALLMEGF